MPSHIARFQIPMADLGKSNISVEVWEDDKKLGTLLVSKGAVVWQPKGSKQPYKMSWSHFHSVMKEHGRKTSGK